jgi:hypothetical protein
MPRDCSGGLREHLELAENGDEDSDMTKRSLLEPIAEVPHSEFAS